MNPMGTVGFLRIGEAAEDDERDRGLVGRIDMLRW